MISLSLIPPRSYYSEYGTEEELESFMKQEVGIQTQALWFLWCDPLKRSCWSCFQEVKRYIYRCCCKSRKLNENDSPKSISSSSHPLNEPNSDSNQHDLNAKIDEESQVKSPTVAPPPSFPRTVNSPLSSDINPSKHTQAPSSTSTKFPQQRMPIPFYRDESRGLQNSSNVFQSSASQRFSTSSRSMTRPEYNPIYSSSTPSNPSHTPFPSTVELGSLRPLPTPSPAISHTNDSLTPIKAPLSELYGSHSSKLYSKPLDDSQTS